MLDEALHLDALLVAGYVIFLLLASMAIELMARVTHHHAERFRTAGFQYHKHNDAWRCSQGNYLWRDKVDGKNRLVSYRANAQVCNGCAIKYLCTNSNEGRELLRPLDPWPHSEVGHFYRGISLTLIAIAGLLLLIDVILHGHSRSELLLYGGDFLLLAVMGLRAFTKFRRTRARFPQDRNAPTAIETVNQEKLRDALEKW